MYHVKTICMMCAVGVISKLMVIRVNNSNHEVGLDKLYNLCSGVSRISFRGGVQKFSGKVGEFAWREAPCSAWQSHAFARGFGGMLPRENFKKWCNLVRFREYFAKILSKNFF